MSQLLEGLEGTLCHMDDVLVFGATQAQHDARLMAVLERLHRSGLTLNTKCEFSKRQVKFLGQVVDGDGVRADPDKVRALTHMTEPKNVTEVRCFSALWHTWGNISQTSQKDQSLSETS